MVQPYQDSSNSVENRVEDLLARLSVQDKAGLMFHDIIMIGPGGQLISSDSTFGRPATEVTIRDMRLNHFNLAGQVDDVRELVAWHNRVQELALATGPGIPVTLSTDPRHAFSNNPGTEALAGAFSQWPQSLGFAALGDAALMERYADIARQEYLAAGIRVALHPQIDLATEPRWARTGMTFGEDADLTSRLVTAYIRGFQGAELGSASVATMTKHFPGGGPQQDGDVIMDQPMPARAWGVEHLSELDRAQKIIDAGCDQFGGESRPELVVELVRSGRVTEERIDQSVRRLLREKFVLGLFDEPFLDVDRAVATIGRADFVAEGEAAQRAALVWLTAADSGPATLPLGTDQAVYSENISSAAAARLGRVVDDPAGADLAVLRLNAPYEPRPGGFESFFHAGSLEFPAAERDRIVAICERVPTIIVLFLDRPAIVPEIAEAAAALLVEFGARDGAVVDILLGEAQARGRLPFDLPSSTKAVTDSRSDVPYDTANPLFRFGDGIVD